MGIIYIFTGNLFFPSFEREREREREREVKKRKEAGEREKRAGELEKSPTFYFTFPRTPPSAHLRVISRGFLLTARFYLNLDRPNFSALTTPIPLPPAQDKCQVTLSLSLSLYIYIYRCLSCMYIYVLCMDSDELFACKTQNMLRFLTQMAMPSECGRLGGMLQSHVFLKCYALGRCIHMMLAHQIYHDPSRSNLPSLPKIYHDSSWSIHNVLHIGKTMIVF